MDEAMVAKLEDYERSELPASYKVALRFIESWIQEKARSVDDGFLAELRARFTPAQIIELTYLASIYEAAHKFNHLFEMEAPAEIFEFEQYRVPEGLAGYLAGQLEKRDKAKR